MFSTGKIENQFRFHVDTEQLRKNINKIDLTDFISVSYKLKSFSFLQGESNQDVVYIKTEN